MGDAIRCALCHAPFGDAPPAPCEGCRTLLHADCASQLGRCPTLGCPRGVVEAPRQAKPEPPAFALYSPNQVLIAGLLGSLPGGAAVLALNGWRLGRRGLAVAIFVVAVAATAALMVALERGVPEREVGKGKVFALLSILALRQVAVLWQGAAFGAHLAAGGRRGSTLAAAGWSLLGLMAMLGAVVTALVAHELLPA